jgi:hypothetical protein
MDNQSDVSKVLKEVEHKMKRTRFGNIKIVVSENSDFVDIVTEERTRIFKNRTNKNDSMSNNTNVRKG